MIGAADLAAIAKECAGKDVAEWFDREGVDRDEVRAIYAFLAEGIRLKIDDVEVGAYTALSVGFQLGWEAHKRSVERGAEA